MNKLSQFVISYLEMCEYEKKLSPDTVKAYRIDLAQFLDFSEGGEVDVNTIDRYIRYLNQSFAPRTVKREIAEARPRSSAHTRNRSAFPPGFMYSLRSA